MDGKPRIVWQKYLDKLEDISPCPGGAARGTPHPPAEDQSAVTDFGAAAALNDLSHRLDVVGIIDARVPKRGSGPSVGSYLLGAILSRCLAPRSKARVIKWFDQKVRVHVFTCVVAFLLLSLPRRELAPRGFHLSIPRMPDILSHIRAVITVFPPQPGHTEPTLRTSLTRMSQQRRALFQILDLKRYTLS